MRGALPSEAEPALRLTELILPTAIALGYELGQQTFLDTVGAADARARPVVLAVVEQLQRFTLDGLLEVADRTAAEIVDRIRLALAAGDIDETTGQALRVAVPAVRALVARAEGTLSAEITADDLFAVATEPLTALIDLCAPLLEEETLADWGTRWRWHGRPLLSSGLSARLPHRHPLAPPSWASGRTGPATGWARHSRRRRGWWRRRSARSWEVPAPR